MRAHPQILDLFVENNRDLGNHTDTLSPSKRGPEPSISAMMRNPCLTRSTFASVPVQTRIACGMAFEIEDGRIRAMYVVRNTDKLRHLAPAVSPALSGSGARSA
jgi:hypothetical protein